jgi:putative membrane protein
MTRLLGVLALAAAMAGCSSFRSSSSIDDANAANNGGRTNNPPASSDERFIMDAAASGMYESEAGQIATNKGSSERVKSIGEQMVNDQIKSNDRLMQLSKRMAVAMPPVMSAKQKDMLARLRQLQGSDFDKEFLKQQEAMHQETIAHFQKEAKSGHDSELREFAAHTLPTLQKDLRIVRGEGEPVRLGSERD